MSLFHTALGAIACMTGLLTACEATGDPAGGGLFGWSETKAQQRLVDRQTVLARVEGERDREHRATAALQRAREQNRQAFAASTAPSPGPAEDERRRSQLAGLATLADDADRLEADSPTPAGASRARRIHRTIERLQGDDSLTADQRADGIANVRAEIERARLPAGRPSH